MKKKQIFVALVLVAFLTLVGCSESEESNAIDVQPSYSPEDQAYIDRIRAEAEASTGAVDDMADIVKKCNLDIHSPTKESVDCLNKHTNEIENTSDAKIAFCKRETRIYMGIAIARDNGASLEEARRLSLDSLKKITNDAKNNHLPEFKEELYQQMENVLKTVYSRPDDSPAKIHKDMYTSCINS